MKKYLRIIPLFAFLLAVAVSSVSAQTLTAPMREDGDELEIDQLKEYREMAWDQWEETLLDDETGPF